MTTFTISGGNTWDQQVGMYDVPDIQIYNMRTGEWKKGRVSFNKQIDRELDRY